MYTLYTAFEWAWSAQQRANHLLEEVRNRQAELTQMVGSFQMANVLLRRTERELFDARKQAEEALRMKEMFAANISHELRTPLNLILGFSELMHLSPEIYGSVNWSPTLRRDVYQIYRSSNHLLNMIDDILALSRFERVGLALHKESTPLPEFLQSAAEIAQDLFRNSAVRLELEIEPSLPALHLDRTRIRQVLLNLLNNALCFTAAGVVRLLARSNDHEIIISVSDTGPQ